METRKPFIGTYAELKSQFNNGKPLEISKRYIKKYYDKLSGEDVTWASIKKSLEDFEYDEELWNREFSEKYYAEKVEDTSWYHANTKDGDFYLISRELVNKVKEFGDKETKVLVNWKGNLGIISYRDAFEL